MHATDIDGQIIRKYQKIEVSGRCHVKSCHIGHPGPICPLPGNLDSLGNKVNAIDRPPPKGQIDGDPAIAASQIERPTG